MNYETAKEIEVAVADWFDYRRYIIVPNVSWGLGLRFECDLAVLSLSGYLYEVEIKISRSDIIRDQDKRKWKWGYHDGDKIRKMWFAIPESLRDAIVNIPPNAGVLVVEKSGFVKEIRPPYIDKRARKLTDKEQFKLACLGTMRIWGLKRALIQNHDGVAEHVTR